MAFFCRSCNVGLTSQERQKEHHKLDILQHLYHCQRCSCTFKTYSELNNHFDHTKVHQEEKVPPSNVKPSKYCVHCRRKFKSDGQFAIHLKRAHKEMGHCRECGKVFSDKSALNQHRKSPAHSQKDFPCPHCTRSFKNASAVSQHLQRVLVNPIVTEVVRQLRASGNIITSTYDSPTGSMGTTSDSE